MAVTKGEMTSLPTSQPIFLQTAEEPEDNRINFRDSLKFFQEQLVINGANFPSPSPVSRSSSNTLRKNGHRSYKSQNSDNSEKIPKDNNDSFESDIQSIKSCKIPIPTVDTILESVRVLRAIQKSQEERGSSWNLEVTSKSEITFNYTDEWIQVTDINQNVYSDKECSNDRNNETTSTNSEDNQTVPDINRNGGSVDEPDKGKNDDIPSSKVEETHLVADINEKGFSKKTSKNENNEIISSTLDKQTDINQNGYSDKECNNERNIETSAINSEDKQTITDVNQNGYLLNECDNARHDKIPSTNTEEAQLLANVQENEHSDKTPKNENKGEIISNNLSGKETDKDINQNEYSDAQSNCERNEPFSCDSVDKKKTEVETQINDTKENLTHSNNDSQANVSSPDSVNETCSFWPSNTLQNINQWHEEKTRGSHSSAEGGNIISEIVSGDKKNLIEQIQQNDSKSIILKDINASEKLEHLTKEAEIYDTPDSLHVVCTNLLNHLNEKIPNTKSESKEMLLNESENTTEILKIETYVEIDSEKHDHFLLNESLWKESCSPNDSISTKIEHNDSDSGIGTQRSASSLSPNNPNLMQKDSWSDTCSSQYASAECSPYHSLNSVFESSVGLNSTTGEAREIENADILTRLTENDWEDAVEKPQESIRESNQEDHTSVPQQTDCDKEKDHISDKCLTDSPIQLSDFESHSDNAELDTEISYCNFITNYTIENPSKRIQEKSEEAQIASEICDNKESESKTVNGQENSPHVQTSDTEETAREQIFNTENVSCEQTFDTERTESVISLDSLKYDVAIDDDSCELSRVQKFTATSCDLISIVESLYTIKENPAYQVLPTGDAPEEKFEETLFLLSKGAFCEHPEADYLVIIENSILYIMQNSQVLLSLNMKYGEISVETNILKIDNRMGRCVYVKCDFADIQSLRARIQLHCLKHWQTDCLQLVHYPLKCHQNVVIIDIGSCSTRAGILMDQPTLPSLFFPTICATDKKTGTCVYGMEALRPEVRQHSNLSFPVRPTIKITKHTIDIDLMEGLFKKIFHSLNVDPTQYTVQVCLPRNLSINAQTALVKLLLENLKAKAVSLTNQALLTLYAHDVSTAVVVDIGDRTDVLPVVDGFIVENGVTRLPHGGQRLIHHMKHGLAEKRISLSNDIDSFVVQYIIENLAYVAEDYDTETRISSQYPDTVTKTVTLQPASSESLHSKNITLEEARFKIPEGLFNPELWGLDSPGIHHLVQKAIQATSVDVRKRIAENIYVSGGVTMLPGFVERLNKEVAKLSKAKIVPKVYASNYRYHCTYIGACKFAKMEVFPQVCVNLQEFTESSASALKKCALYF